MTKLLNTTAFVCAAFICLFNCATNPKREGSAAVATVDAVTIQAIDCETVEVSGKLKIASLLDYNAILVPSGFVLTLNGIALPESMISMVLPLDAEYALTARSEIHVPFSLCVRYQIPDQGAEAVLGMEATLRLNTEKAESELILAQGSLSFPLIRDPVLTVKSIRIKQAELINTRLEVMITLENPNLFPLVFNSFTHELYGEGRFWADGTKDDEPVLIEGLQSADIKLLLVMNFINMKRSLLDQIIRMDAVQYRLKGQSIVDTGLSFLPRFVMDFDESGHSAVVR